MKRSNPKDEKTVPLVDDPSVKEVFASEVASVGLMGDTMILTLCVSRATTDFPKPEIKRFITARIVMPAEPALDLSNKIRDLLQSRGLIQAQTGTKPN